MCVCACLAVMLMIINPLLNVCVCVCVFVYHHDLPLFSLYSLILYGENIAVKLLQEFVTLGHIGIMMEIICFVMFNILMFNIYHVCTSLNITTHVEISIIIPVWLNVANFVVILMQYFLRVV